MFRFGDPGGRVYAALGTSNVNFLALWTTLTVGSSTLSLPAGGGRTTGTCLRFTPSAASNYIHATKTLDAQATWGVAFALRVSAFPTGGRIQFLTLEDAATVQVGLYLNTDGTLQVERGGAAGNSAGGTLLGSASAVVLSLGTWAHFELKVVVNNTTGTIELRKNGTAVIGPTTGLNTRASANNSANVVRLGFIGNPGLNAANITNANYDFDDFIVWDGQATDAAGNADINNFIGDCGLSWLLPTGAGTTTQFTPDSGVNYTRVNEATPDLTSYVESATVGQKDTYALADLGAGTSAVKSVAVLHYARKTDVGSRQMGAVLRSGGTDYTHATGVDLGDTYAYSFRNWGSNPNGAAAWTSTSVNALEIGQIVNS